MQRSVVMGYILKKKKRKNMRKILKIVFEDFDEIRKIDSNICPFCGERFKRRMGFIVHLKREYKTTACSAQFNALVTEIISRYKAFKSCLVRGSREGRVVMLIGGEKKIFESYREAYLYFKNYENKMRLSVLSDEGRMLGREEEEVKYVVY